MFKIGDIVTGRNTTDYFYTNSTAIMRVVDVHGEGVSVVIEKSPYLVENNLHNVSFTIDADTLILVTSTIIQYQIAQKIAFMYNRWANRKN